MVNLAVKSQMLGEKPELFEDPSAELANLVAREKGVPWDSLRAVLTKAREAGIPDYEVSSQIEALANEVMELRAREDETSRARRFPRPGSGPD